MFIMSKHVFSGLLCTTIMLNIIKEMIKNFLATNISCNDSWH
jgi:hypothetical protein